MRYDLFFPQNVRRNFEKKPKDILGIFAIRSDGKHRGFPRISPGDYASKEIEKIEVKKGYLLNKMKMQ